MNLVALNKDYNVVKTLTTISNLVWYRKYYEIGEFTLEMSSNEYTEEMVYLYRTDRRELGMFNKKEIKNDGYQESMLVSGYFVENKLNDKVTYPNYTASELDTETIVKNAITTYMGIDVLENKKRGETQSLESIGESLTFVYNVLKTIEFSPKIDFDFKESKLTFDIWQGLDRTHSQDVNSRCLFSMTNKNIESFVYTSDNTLNKNVVHVVDSNTGKVYTLDKSNEEYQLVGYVEDRFDSATDDIMKTYAEEYITYNTDIKNIEVVLLQKLGYEYMKDYDLGDLCDIEIKGNYMSRRIIAIREVYKNNNVEIEAEFGEAIPTK